ncbi:hypothetical protein LUZ60_005153 [Juncus effusus]|nr:hypothetical protein LUZ60_005153 [Juncus effusus]
MAGSGFGSELSLRLGSEEGGIREKDESENKKTMTIFYNGEMCVCDLTEFQARAIISTAMQEIKNDNEQKNERNSNNSNTNNKIQTSSAVVHHIPTPIPASELSMKRSLQRFLQKRKTRMAAASPYSQKEQLLSL